MRIKKILLVLVGALVLVVCVIALQIYTYADNVANVQADAAIVLGAALWGKDLSPVFTTWVT